MIQYARFVEVRKTRMAVDEEESEGCCFNGRAAIDSYVGWQSNE
jgi:hypothetical protein